MTKFLRGFVRWKIERLEEERALAERTKATYPKGYLAHEWAALSVAVLDMKIAIWRALSGAE